LFVLPPANIVEMSASYVSGSPRNCGFETLLSVIGGGGVSASLGAGEASKARLSSASCARTASRAAAAASMPTLLITSAADCADARLPSDTSTSKQTAIQVNGARMARLDKIRIRRRSDK
jgi:hypothetical protein